MAQEYLINSQELEAKVRKLLPSQGGLGAGQDLSASTQIVPIIDLTESAEGSNLRQDLQSAFSHDTATNFNVNNTSTTIISTTGYWRIFGVSMNLDFAGGTSESFIGLNDGTTTKKVFQINTINVNTNLISYLDFDFIVKLGAGDSVIAETSQYNRLAGATRQLADINGTLVNP